MRRRGEHRQVPRRPRRLRRCLAAVLRHGSVGYAKECHVDRLLREVTITRIGPITEQLILSFIAEKVLDLPKSY